MKVVVLGPRKRSPCEEWIFKEAKRSFKKAVYAEIPKTVVKNGNVIYENFVLNDFDCIIPRIPRTYAWYGFILLSKLLKECYLPLTPESVILAHNKFLTLVALKEAGIPVPKTYLAYSRDVLEKLAKRMKYPVVLKLIYGSLGRGVMFADSLESAKSIMDALERFRQPIFLEEYVENPGEDIRAFVLGDKVLAAEKRVAPKRERRTNIGIGGKGVAIKKLDPEIEDIAVRASHALGMEISGIDIIESEKGPVVIEANVNVHFEGLTKVTGINVAKHIVEFVKKETKEFKRPPLRRFFEWLGRRFT